MVSTFAAQAGIALELAEHRSDAERLAILQDRDRIARDLHDLVIQRLYATGMSLQGAMPLLTRPEAADRVSNAVDALDETIREIRSAIFSLQPRRRQQRGLRAQVLEVVDEMTAALGFAPSLRLVGPLDETVPADVGEQLLGALREALSNAARHAHASRVDVTVEVRSRTGPAGPGRRHRDGPVTRRSGLANLAERAADLGGKLQSAPPRAAAPSSTGGCRSADRDPRRGGARGRRRPGVRRRRVVEDPGGVGRGLGAALHAELGEQGGDVVLDGLLGEEQPVADLPVGQALADQLEDAAFLVGERRPAGRRGGLVAHPAHHAWRWPRGRAATARRRRCARRRPGRCRGSA